MTTVHPRRGIAVLAAILAGLLAAVYGTTPALAYSSGTIYGGSGIGGFFTTYEYEPWATIPPNQDWLNLTSQPQTLASGKCFDALFDWSRGGLHYDARLARSCKSWTVRRTQVSHEAYNVDSPHRLGNCYGTNQNTAGSGSICHFTIGGSAGMVTKVGATEWCIRGWSMTPTGTLQFFNGGSPISCTS